MKGDREVCLAAGMDDYLPKPISMAELLAMIYRLTTGNEHAARKATASEAAIDLKGMMARVEGDQELLADWCNSFARKRRACCPRSAAA